MADNYGVPAGLLHNMFKLKTDDEEFNQMQVRMRRGGGSEGGRPSKIKGSMSRSWGSTRANKGGECGGLRLAIR